MKDEREALEHAMPLVRFLRAERFRDLAQPEQQLAARFIINRLAMFKMVEYGEDECCEPRRRHTRETATQPLGLLAASLGA